ncbi:hypothetical protein TKK_0007618 [Trichogramma kaykai]|uniref:EamA domain-containing protein n=1 Tax=Trichogramma kaykai TaxID=54128 RepID=A0ABD2X8M4_9HYME
MEKPKIKRHSVLEELDEEDPTGAMRRTERLFTGLIVLGIVNILWNASIRVTKHVQPYVLVDRPFFVLFFRAALLSLYCLGWCMWSPWRRRIYEEIILYGKKNENTFYVNGLPRLSTPSFVPIKYDETSDAEVSMKENTIKFKNTVEVRQMSDEDAAEAQWSRFSYDLTLGLELLEKEKKKKQPISEHIKMAISCALFWAIAQCMSYRGTQLLPTSSLAVSSASCSATIFILLGMFNCCRGQRLNMTEMFAVIVSSLSLVATLKIAEPAAIFKNLKTFPSGLNLCFLSGLFYGIFMVTVKTKTSRKEFDIPMLYSIMGLFLFLIGLPGLYMLDRSGIELFEWPNNYQWIYLIVNEIIRTVFCEVFWLWATSMATPIIALLSIPLCLSASFVLDMRSVMDQKNGILRWIISFFPTFFSVIFLIFVVIFDNCDPVYEMVKSIAQSCSRKKVLIKVLDSEKDQTEQLICTQPRTHEA